MARKRRHHWQQLAIVGCEPRPRPEPVRQTVTEEQADFWRQYCAVFSAG